MVRIHCHGAKNRFSCIRSHMDTDHAEQLCQITQHACVLQITASHPARARVNASFHFPFAILHCMVRGSMRSAHRQLNILPPPQVLVLAQPTCVVPFQMACLQRQHGVGRQPAVLDRVCATPCVVRHPQTLRSAHGGGVPHPVAGLARWPGT